MDKELVQRFTQGNDEAFKALYIKYKPAMHKFILNFTNDPDLSEDIIQEVFVAVWLNRKNIDPNKSFSSYLFTCVKNKVFDFFKELAKNRDLMEKNWNNFDTSRNETEEELDLLDLNELVTNAIRHLSSRKRAIFELSKFKGKTHEQIAEELGISKNTVKNHMVESLKFIKNFIRHHGEIALNAVLFSLFLF